MGALFNFQVGELPRLLNETGLLPEYPADSREDDRPQIDLTPIREFNLTLCYGKEWHRFPGHYHVPDGVRVEFVKSEFSGLLPGHFGEDEVKADHNGNSALERIALMEDLKRKETWNLLSGMAEYLITTRHW